MLKSDGKANRPRSFPRMSGKHAVAVTGTLTVLLGILLAFAETSRLRHLDNGSRSYVALVVPQVVQEWDETVFSENASAQLLAAAPIERVHKLMVQLKDTLGRLKTLRTINLVSSEVPLFGTTGLIYYEYRISAEFEKAPAKILVAVTRTNTSWKMLKFNVQSDALLKD